MSQISDGSNSYKEWLETSIQQELIYCCPESDIKLDPIRIGHGAFGEVYKATIKRRNNFTKTILGKKHNILSGMTVAVKTLFQYNHGDCEKDLHRLFIKEVHIIFQSYLLHHVAYDLILRCTLAKTPPRSKQSSQYYSFFRALQRHVNNIKLVNLITRIASYFLLYTDKYDKYHMIFKLADGGVCVNT